MALRGLDTWSQRAPVTGVLLVACLAASPTTGSPVAGHAICFGCTNDGARDFLSIPHDPGLSTPTGVTIEGWVKTSGPDGIITVLTKGDAGRCREYVLEIEGALRFGLSLTGVCCRLDSPPLFPYDNLFHHVAGTYDGSVMHVYLDGNEVGSFPTAGTIQPCADHPDLTMAFDGATTLSPSATIDEVRFWTVARSAGEIRAAMRLPLVGTEPGLEAYWKMDEGSPSQTVQDSSGHGHTGTLGLSTDPDYSDPAFVGSEAPLTCRDCDGDGYEWPVDCNDADPTIHPSAPEMCNGRDEDCDQNVDDSDSCDLLCAPAEDVTSSIQVIGSGGFGVFGSGLVWTGTEYGVAWTLAGGPESTRLYLTRISAVGLRIDSDVLISPTPHQFVSPSLVWTGTEYAVAWLESSGGVYFARLSAGGSRIAPDSRLLDVSSIGATFKLLWTGTDYALVWWDGSRFSVMFALVDRYGALVGTPFPLALEGVEALDKADITWNGSHFAFAWRGHVGASFSVSFARADHSGQLVTGPLSVSSTTTDPGQPRIAWTGAFYAVVWSESTDSVTLAQLSPLGQRTAGDIALRYNPQFFKQDGKPAIAWSGAEFGVAWDVSQKEGAGGEALVFATVDPVAGVGGSAVSALSGGGGASTKEEIVWSGQN
jgi:hypothetical protein